MSYILDALRKSEQERLLAEGKSPGVLHPVAVAPRRLPGHGRAIAGSVVLGIAALAISGYFLLRAHPPAPPAAKATVQAVVIPAPSMQVPPVEVSPPPPPAPSATPSNRVVVAKPAAPVPDKPLAQPIIKMEVAEPRQEEVPAFNISGYIRDGEAGGMAMINDKLVREGEEVVPGLRLEKILPDGAVFNYKGRRFTR